MTDRELALKYCRAREAGLVFQSIGYENEIAERENIPLAAMVGPKIRREHMRAFVSRSLAFDPELVRTVGVRFLSLPGGFVRPENPFVFVPHEVHVGDVAAMITGGPLPIDPPDGWAVVVLHDGEGWLVTTMPSDDVEVIR